jgi:ATP-binding cassette, subfamily B, multidrug efflux pump
VVYLLCILGLVLSSLFGLLVPWMIREAIDGIASPDGQERLVQALAWMILFAFLHAVFRYCARRGLLVTARRIEQKLRQDVFAHVVRLPMAFYGATPTGDVLSRMTNDVSAVWLFLGPGTLTLTGTLVTYVLALAFMLRISGVLTAAVLLLAPAVVLLSREYGRAFHRLHRDVQESLADMNGMLQENVSGIRFVKAYGLEEREGARFAERCREYYRHNVAVSRTQAAFHGAIGFAASAGTAVVLGIGGWLVIRGDLTLGGFVAFNAYLAMLAFPTMALGWVINLFQRGGSAMGRINEFMRLRPEPSVEADDCSSRSSPAGNRPADEENICLHDDEQGHGGREGAADREEPAAGYGDVAQADLSRRSAREARKEKEGEADLKESGTREGEDAKADPFLLIHDLSFSFPGAARGRALSGVSLAVSRGEIVGLVGQTGSGKSTLLSLILRLHGVPPGTIILDGRDIGAIPLPELRRRVSLVGQDPFLFSDTILENVCFGSEAPDPDAARRAAGRARILAEVEEMPEGLLTVVGERGISLSGGQKQRITIARALCGAAELLLLDDVLSAVDSETEQEIFREILAIRGDRTILFTTHRMASLSRCDRIVVLSEGRVAEQGTHDDLLTRRGVYFDLYSRQMLVRELETSP